MDEGEGEREKRIKGEEEEASEERNMMKGQQKNLKSKFSFCAACKMCFLFKKEKKKFSPLIPFAN